MIDTRFNLAPTMIGSMPHKDAATACALVAKYLTEIPSWPQLPKRAFTEDMTVQFGEGFPGMNVHEDRSYVQHGLSFDAQMERLYTAYLASNAGAFPVSPDYAAGLYEFFNLKKLRPLGVKGQVTGPLSFGATLKDESRQSILHDDTLSDAAAKLLRLKAAWEENELRRVSKNTIIFVDEPVMASYGSAFFTISKERVRSLLEEVLGGISGLRGIHCCGNTDWSVLLGTSAHIISFDAYHLALRDLHTSAGAAFVVSGEWSLPAHYGDPAAEHAAIRETAAAVDRSHRSRILVSGTDAHVVLGRIFAGHVDDLAEGRAMRTVALDSRGRILDLVLIARTGGIAYLVTGEPGRRTETLARLQDAVEPGFDVRIDDRTETTCLVALTGPSAAGAVNDHLSDALPSRLQALHCVTFELHGFRALAIRASDTGEDGFEFMLAPAVAQHVVETLRTAGIPLAGDLAMESARVEACIPAFDPDLAPGLSPAEAELDVLLDLPAGAANRVLAAILLEGGPVPAGTPLTRKGARVGEMRSCLRSFMLDAVIGLGIVDAPHALPGVALDAGGILATIVTKPFYRRRN